jgi:hypothetical protein
LATVQIKNNTSLTGVPYAAQIEAASQKYGVPAPLIAAVIKQESGFQANAHSSANAMGLMQMIPSTAASMGVTNPYDPNQSIDGGTKYLAGLIKEFNGNIPLALAGYNAGPGAVKKAGNQVPNIPETKNYVSSIMTMYAGGNIDPSLISNDGSSGGMGTGLASIIVNGIQSIFKTMLSDTLKFLLYVILFGLFVFFGYKALQGSPVVSSTTSGVKRAARSGKNAVRRAGQYNANKQRSDRSERLAKRTEELKKVIKYMPK